MRIQHNIMAINAYRNYNANTSAVSKNLEKLSSGYKINRAGDDAAGLAISEKMRAQITGLDAASKNVKDGISLVKTAEGAMQEVQDMLNRMVDLATQSANGTYQDSVDREALQAEIDQLNSEIDRIADSANFNGIKLLDGSLEKGAIRGAAYEKMSASDIAKLLKNNGEGTTHDDVLAGKTVLETDADKAQVPSFAINMEKLTFEGKGQFKLQVGDDIELNAVEVTADMDAAALADAIAKANADVTVGSGSNAIKFTIEAKDGVLTFTGDKQAEYDPADQVKFELTAPADGDAPSVNGGNTVTINSYTGNVANDYKVGSISTTPHDKTEGPENLASITASDGSATASHALTENDLIQLAKKYNASGDVTLRIDGSGTSADTLGKA